MCVVPGALAEAMVVVHQAPVFAAIVRTIESTFFIFNQRIDAVGLSRHCNADSANHSTRKAVAFDLCPGASAIARAIKPAPWPATDHGVRRTVCLPQRGVENAGVRGIEDHVDGAGLVILI